MLHERKKPCAHERPFPVAPHQCKKDKGSYQDAVQPMGSPEELHTARLKKGRKCRSPGSVSQRNNGLFLHGDANRWLNTHILLPVRLLR